MEEFGSDCQARNKYLGRTKWKVAQLEMAESVKAESGGREYGGCEYGG